MNRTYKTEGVVLKRKNLSEADKILTVFSKHYGKIKVIAKGVRKTTSRKAGSLELFNHCFLVLAKCRSLDIILEAQTINSFPNLRKNLLKVSVAYYFCELVDKLTAEGQAQAQVYQLLCDSLKKIPDVRLVALVRNFEEQLLDELGFGIPENIRRHSGSLKSYIESITEKEIQSPKIIKN